MALTSTDIIARENAAVLERMAGMPITPATSPWDADPRNPNLGSCGAGRLAPGSTSGSNPAPRRTEPRLRLAWSAPSRE